MATTGQEILSIAAAVDELEQCDGRIQQLIIDSTLEASAKKTRKQLLKLLKNTRIDNLTLINFPSYSESIKVSHMFRESTVIKSYKIEPEFLKLLSRLNTAHLTLWNCYLCEHISKGYTHEDRSYISKKMNLSPVVEQLTVHNTKAPYCLYLMNFLDRTLANASKGLKFKITGAGTNKKQLSFLSRSIKLRREFRDGYLGLDQLSDTVTQDNRNMSCP